MSKPFIQKYGGESVKFSFVGLLYSMCFLFLMFMMVTNPGVTEWSREKFFLFGSCSFVVLVASIIDITRGFTIAAMVQEYGLNDEALEYFEHYNRESDRLAAFINRFKVTDEEVALIAQWRDGRPPKKVVDSDT